MLNLVQEIQSAMKLSHLHNCLLKPNDKKPYYLPNVVAELFRSTDSDLIIVQFNKVILFGQIRVNDKENLIVGPMTTQNLYYSLPFEAFSYLNNSKQYQKLKLMIDQQANFSVEDFSLLLQKIASFLLNKDINPKIFHRNNYSPDELIDSEPSKEDLVRDFHAAISHGDVHRIQQLSSYPQTYLKQFIDEGKASDSDMRKEFYQAVITAGNLASLQGVSLAELKPIQNKYYKLWQNTELTPIKAGHIMLSSIMEITELVKEKKSNIADDPIIKHIYTYMDHNFQQPISRKDITEALNVSPSYLSTHVKKKTGHTLTYLIQAYKINKAEMLLESDQASIIEISNFLGFSNVTYFNRIFKKITGVTPSQYRKEH